MTAHAIEAHGLRKSFGDVVAVDALDLVVESGSIFCLLGRNGAGKTTTVRMLATLLAPDAGEASVAGVSLTDPQAVRRHIGVALQEVALDPMMTALEHLDLALRLTGWSRGRRMPRRDELVERFGLTAFAARPVRQLSGGMRRRVDIALALVNEPAVLFLDEPSAGLDVEGKEEVWSMVRSLRAAGHAVLLTTHDLDEATRLSDTIGIMHEGRMLMVGSADDLAAGGAEGLRELFLGSTR